MWPPAFLFFSTFFVCVFVGHGLLDAPLFPFLQGCFAARRRGPLSSSLVGAAPCGRPPSYFPLPSLLVYFVGRDDPARRFTFP